MCTMNEATTQVDNLRERGKQLYLKAKAEGDRDSLRIAGNLFRRGAQFSSPNVSLEARASVNKNLLASLSLEQAWDNEDNASSKEPGEAFFKRVTDASNAYRNGVHFSSVCSSDAFSSQWRQSLALSFHRFISEALKIVALSDSAESDRDVDRRAQVRVHAMLRFTSMDYPLAPSLLAHVQFRIADVLLKASVVASEEKHTTQATSLVLKAESHLPCLDEAVLNTLKQQERTLPVDMDVDALKSQIEYQVCVAKSAQKLCFGNTLLNQVKDSTFTTGDEHGRILMAMDAFKEAQVLARETSLPQEAQACARLAFIYRTLEYVKDDMKSECYYMQAFNILEGLGLQPYVFVDWAKDVMTQRERIQKERAKSADERKQPVLARHKDLLASIKSKATSSGDEKEALLFVYEVYPPKGGQEAPKEKIENGDLKSAMKVTLLHYHPDHNREERYGFDNAVICEEITKFVNLMYARNFKDM